MYYEKKLLVDLTQQTISQPHTMYISFEEIINSELLQLMYLITMININSMNN